MEIRKAVPADYPSLVALTGIEGWNYTLDDFSNIDGSGCSWTLVAMEDGAHIGMITLSDFGSVGWISNVLVEKSMRGKGIGERLFLEGVGQLSGKNTIALFAYQESKGFYLKQGMRLDRDFSYVKFKGGRKGSAREGALTESVFSLDEQSFGCKRRCLLRMLMKDGHIIFPPKGRGYAILRPDPVEAIIGPVTAENTKEGRDLLYAAFNMLGVGSLAVVPEGNLEGVEEVFKVSRYYFGERPFTDLGSVQAFSGLEFG